MIMHATPMNFAPGHGSGVRVDLTKLIVSKMLLQAASGGGKSQFLRALLEQTHGRVQHFVHDPEGEFPSLREKFDYVLVAAKGGDVLASAKTAAMLCRRLMEMQADAIFDLYDLSKDERREFEKNFHVELMALPRSLWRPLLDVVDEAHEFCPEKGHGEAQSTEAIIDVGSRGRKRGYCLVGATQRIAKIHKDLAAELRNKFIGCTGLDLDLKRAGEELGFDKQQRLVLKSLEPGDFFAYGPAISKDVILVHGPDVVTSHPKIGRLSSRAPPPSSKIKKLLADLQDLPKEAEERARTVETLEHEIRSLKHQLRLANSAPTKVETKEVVTTKTKTVEVPLLGQRERVRLSNLLESAREMRSAVGGLTARTNALCDEAERLRIACLKNASSITPVQLPARPAAVAPQFSPVDVERTSALVKKIKPKPVGGFTPATEPGQVMPAKFEGEPPPVAIRMLDMIASFHPRRIRRSQLATLCEYSNARNGAFLTNISILFTAGLIQKYGDELTLSFPGEARYQGKAMVPPSPEELRALWRSKLPPVVWKMMEAVLETGGISRTDLAQRLDYSNPRNGAFLTNISILNTNSLIVKDRERILPNPLLVTGLAA